MWNKITLLSPCVYLFLKISVQNFGCCERCKVDIYDSILVSVFHEYYSSLYTNNNTIVIDIVATAT